MTGEAAAQWAVSRRIPVGATAVRYRAAGEGPPVVLVHGLGVSADYWTRNGPELGGAGLRALALDLPGFGRTPAGGRAAESPAAQARVLVEWADALAVGPAVYVGHSISCQTVLELAASEPERVRGLILAGPTGAGRPWHRVRQLPRIMIDAFREPLPLITTVALAYLRAGPRRVGRTWLNSARHDPLPLVSKITAPSIVIVGTRDPIVDREFTHTLADALPGGRWVGVEGGSHAVQFSRPREFNRLVEEFVREVS
ncbi:alpha/beta hydrolase [soil metagenome]